MTNERLEREVFTQLKGGGQLLLIFFEELGIKPVYRQFSMATFFSRNCHPICENPTFQGGDKTADLSGEYLGIEESLDRESAVADHGVLQGRRPLADPVPLVLHGILLHAGLEALPEPAVATLVPLVLVHRAVP